MKCFILWFKLLNGMLHFLY